MKKLIFIISFFICGVNAFSTVGGPIRIDILGIDKIENVIYFVKTNWAECDCNPELIKYYIENDSLVSISSWVEKDNYASKDDRIKVVQAKGLDHLSIIDTVKNPNHEYYSFKWLSPVKYYSKVVMDSVFNYPFRLDFGNRSFNYTVCYKQNPPPEIMSYSVTENFGFILCRYRGECFEGNTIDDIILYKYVDNRLMSRRLDLKDRLKAND